MGGGGSNLRINQFNERRTRSFVVPRAERRDRAQREQQRQEFSFHGGYRYERLRGIAARSGDSAYSHFFQRKNR